MWHPTTTTTTTHPTPSASQNSWIIKESINKMGNSIFITMDKVLLSLLIHCVVTIPPVNALTCSAEVGSDFSMVDADGGQILTIKTDNSVHRWCNFRWLPVEGTIKYVSVNGSVIFALRLDGTIMRYLGGTWVTAFPVYQSNFVVVKKKDTMIIVNLLNSVYCGAFNQAHPTYIVGITVGLLLQLVACGLHDCWGISPAGTIIYLDTNTCTSNGVSYSYGRMFVNLDVGDDDTVYAITSTGELFKSVGVGTSIISWQHLLAGTLFKHVSVDGDNLWLITQDGKLMFCE
uniref:fish-egg lectin-like n=1 Tax=Myxine glutinosa TaxID=7769 RepID=UPI00358EC475